MWYKYVLTYYERHLPERQARRPVPLQVSSQQSLEAVVSFFRSAHKEPDSAVRAIHHQPAAEGTWAEIPAAVDPRLRAALEKRGIARL